MSLKIMTNNHHLTKKVDEAAKLHNRLVAITGQATLNFFQFGEVLKEIRDKQHWLTLGFDSFEAYYSDPEFAYSKSSVYHAISLVENFPKWREMPPVPVRKLIMIIPRLTDGNKEKLLEMATGLSSSDLKYELQNFDVVNPEEHTKPIPKAYRCNECGGIKGIFWEDLCSCGFTPEQIKKIKAIMEERS